MAARWVVRGCLAGVVPLRQPAPGWVLVDGARFGPVGDASLPPPPVPVVDVGAMLVCPGFVDVHVHGGGGRQVGGDNADEALAAIRALAAHHCAHGTTALLPTTASDSPGRLMAAAAAVAAARSASRGEAEVLGLHLEGPWIAPTRAGAHDPAHIRAPDPGELRRLVSEAAGTLRIVTYAPELPGASDLVAVGLDAGVTMSVGHTAASFETVAAALRGGASHVTHLGNAMAGVDRRDPGPVAAALADGRATVEVVADGHHLHPGFLAMAAVAARERLVAVTDATAACGMPEGVHRLGRRPLAVDSHGKVTLAGDRRVLAGSVLTMDAAMRGLRAAGVDLAGAVHAVSTAPAGVAGASRKGSIRPGLDADLVILDGDLRVAATVVRGQVANDPGDLLGAVAHLARQA